MSRELVLVIYRALKAIIAQLEKDYKLGVYAVKTPTIPHDNDDAGIYVIDN